MINPALLVPRNSDDALAQKLRETGLKLVCAPVTKKIPTPTETWVDPLQRLQDGEYDWVVISSVSTADFLNMHYDLPSLFANVKVAAVGRASAQAIEKYNVKVDLVGSCPASAETLVEEFPHGNGHVLLPGAAGAAPTMGLGLNKRGYDVEKLKLYESVAVDDLPLEWEMALAAGNPTVALITAGSVARAAHNLLTKASVKQWPKPIAFGMPSARTLSELGWPVAAVCASANVEGIVTAYQEITEALNKKD